MTDAFDGVELTTSDVSKTESGAAHAVIWLHGLGADGNDFAPLVPELEKLGVVSTRFIFPHAPMRAVTINAGMEMRAWYDITSLDFDQREQDVDGTIASQKIVQALIDRELSRDITAENLVIAGFSQGGAVALHTATRLNKRIAGVMALSTYLPLADKLETEKSEHTDLPVFMAHGVQDDVIALKYAEASRKQLEDSGYSIEWHTYPMPHSVSMEEIEDIAKWLVKVFGS